MVRAATDRLDRLAQEWLPAPPAERTDGDDGLTVPVDRAAWDRLLASVSLEVDGSPATAARSRAVRIGGWSTSAARGLLVLVVVAAALVTWWWWSGRPVAVAVAPAVVATGPGLGSSANEAGVDPTARTPVVASVAGTQQPAPITGGDADPASEVVVHVAGLVARPGLVRLPVGARVADAIAAAGGVTKRRAAESVNLARVVADGEQIVVTLVLPVSTTGVTPGAPMTTGGRSSTPVDLNLASADQLEGLPGVGPVLAERIAQWRSDNGPFRSVDELGEVSGIGDATLAELRPLVRVG